MAVGETSGQSGPRRLITAGGGRRRAEGFPGPDDDAPPQRRVPEDEVVDGVTAEGGCWPTA